MNQISGLMITAVAGGGVVTPLLGMALDFAGVTAVLSVILLCVLYLILCFWCKNTILMIYIVFLPRLNSPGNMRK